MLNRKVQQGDDLVGGFYMRALHGGFGTSADVAEANLGRSFLKACTYTSCGWRYANPTAGKFQFRLRQDIDLFQ